VEEVQLSSYFLVQEAVGVLKILKNTMGLYNGWVLNIQSLE